MGVGYIIGPRLAALNFSGGVLAWGLLAPIITYFKYGNGMPANMDYANCHCPGMEGLCKANSNRRNVGGCGLHFVENEKELNYRYCPFNW